MIVIAGSLKIKSESVADMQAAAQTLVLATRAEAGCISYVFSQDVEWESDEALGSHFTQPHMAAFGAVIGGAAAGAPVGYRYDAENKKSLFG
jgi:quinol monooxygenase YgiN